jgi:hypothetical protein
MREVIESISEARKACLAGDTAGCLAIINASAGQHAVTLKHSQARDVNFFQNNLTDAEFDAVFNALYSAEATTPRVKEALGALRSPLGLDMSNPLVQGMLEVFRPVWGDALTDKMKGYGVEVKSPAQNAKGRDAVAQDVTDAKTQIELVQPEADGHNAVVDAIESGDVTTTGQAAALFARTMLGQATGNLDIATGNLS